jgi:hypothetical protein
LTPDTTATAPKARHEQKNPQPRFIVLDANVLISDYWLRSPSFVLLRDFLKKSKATLVVPKVVLEEVINHRREDLAKAKSEIHKALREFNRLIRDFTGLGSPAAVISKKSREDPYEKFLSSELGNLNAQTPDYSDIPHTEVVKRDLDRRKPFQESGKGYRDTLLWETIVRNCIKKDTATVLITDNVRDFYHSGDHLHKDLSQELVAKNVEGSTVILCRDLATFTDTYIVPYLRKRKDFAVLVQNRKVQGLDLSKVCDENIDSLIESLNESPFVMMGDPGQYEPEVDVVDVGTEFNVTEASEVSENVLLVVFVCQAEVSFTFFLSHSEYYSMSERESRNIAVLEPNWNEHVMQVETSTSASFMCRLTFNSETQEVESFEVESVESLDDPSSNDE